MAATTNGIKIKQIAKIVQKELGTLFLTESASLFDHAFISVTMVNLSSDLSLAKVYLSVGMNKHQEALLKKIERHANRIRRLLGKRLGGKIHSVPRLKFMIDNSVIQGARVTALIDELVDMEG